MKRFYLLTLTSFMLLFLTVQVKAQVVEKSSLKIGFKSAGVVQFLEDDDKNNSFGDVPYGFQSAVGNLTFDANIVNGIDVYFDLYLSSKHHEGTVYSHEGYIYLSHLPEDSDPFGFNRIFKYIDIKAGHFELDFGNQHLVRSDNADVQRNPLIGNYIVDANTVSPSVEVIGHPAPFYWVGGVSMGTTTGDFKENRGTAFYGKIGSDYNNMLNVTGSYYRVDHSKNPTGYPNSGSFSSLFSGNRSGGRYSGVLGGGPEPGQIKPGKGQDVTAWQVDATLKYKRLTVSGLFGLVKDADINGSADGTPEEKWSYYGGEAKYDLYSGLYVAARYNVADVVKMNGLEAEGTVSRIQLGLGVWVVPGMLLKAEYVNHITKDFTTTALQYDPEFSGFLTEVSISF